MAVLEIAKIQVRRGEELQTGIPQLEPGEFGWAEDTENLYIGKRVIEGAIDDNNTRILTENDLNFFRVAIQSTGTAASSYLYRQNISIQTDPINGYLYYTSSTTVQSKLDQSVSLSDFGVIPSTTPVDITLDLERAIQDLFFNSTWDDWKREDTRRTLLIPAGNYMVSETIKLPPYTKLVGEGSAITKLILTSPISNLFKTVDALGRTFEDGNMESGLKRSRGIHIEGMTLAFKTNNSENNNSLLSLDNTLDAIVEDVLFKTDFTSTSTTTFGITSFGTGIEIRGIGGGVGSGDVNLCENIRIHNCKFDGLNKGVKGAGPIIRPIISNSIFSNLHQGIELIGTGASPGPMNGHIFQNRFENILERGLYVDSGITTVRNNIISENNFFVQVGNGNFLDDHITVAAFPIIEFASEGNQTINDIFQRKVIADAAPETANGFYYNPLVLGNTVINDGSIYSTNIASSSTGSLMKLPCTEEDQVVDVRYQITGTNISRKGHLTINVADSVGNYAFASLSDSYNFIETLETKIASFAMNLSIPLIGIISDIQAPSHTEPVKVTTNLPHKLPAGVPVVLFNMSGMEDLQGNTYYISVNGTQTNNLFLWHDEDLSLPVDGVGFAAYLSGGEVYYSLLPNQFAVNLSLYSKFEDLIGPAPYPSNPISVPAGWYITPDGTNFACITEYIVSTDISGAPIAVFSAQSLSGALNFADPSASWALVKSTADGQIDGNTILSFEVASNFADPSSQNYMVLKCSNKLPENLKISYQVTTQL